MCNFVIVISKLIFKAFWLAASVKQIMLQIIGNLNMQILKSNIFLTDGRCYCGGNVLLTDFTQVVDDNISLFMG